MPKKQKMAVTPKIQSDGSLRINVETDAYATFSEFMRDGGPQLASQMVSHGIEMGLYKDLRLIEFYRPNGKNKDIEFYLFRLNGEQLNWDPSDNTPLEGVETLSPAGVRN